MLGTWFCASIHRADEDLMKIISHEIEQTPEGLYRGTVYLSHGTTVEIVKETPEAAEAWCREFGKRYG